MTKVIRTVRIIEFETINPLKNYNMTEEQAIKYEWELPDEHVLGLIEEGLGKAKVEIRIVHSLNQEDSNGP